jgi:hypothetical protein
LQAWLYKIGEQIDSKADTDLMHGTVASASKRAQECLDQAAEALENAVNCASAALRQELKGSTEGLVSAQAALTKRVSNFEADVAKVPSIAQVQPPHLLSITSSTFCLKFLKQSSLNPSLVALAADGPDSSHRMM